MCYYTQQSATIEKVGKRFRSTVDFEENFLQSDYIVGFEFLNIPVILANDPQFIRTDFSWGLIPTGKDGTFRKNMLNARVETLDSKPSFSGITANRCLVLATAYFDWHWNDEKGKSKTKFQINSAEDAIFAFAGLYDSWTTNAGKKVNTFSIVTTKANNEMRYVHNRKADENDQRMPVVLRKGAEADWLNVKNPTADFAYPNYDQQLIMFPV